ncbi:MAG: MMPL family transporter [Deltaproteobacteria bacterium]|nr:MMPL family transporter [Deltaproteobacteria bacterium]
MVRFVRWILNHPIFALIFLLVPTLYFVTKISHLEINTSQEAMFGPDDPEMQYYKDFIKDFGSDEVLFVFFEQPDVFNINVLKTMDRMTKRFQSIQHVEQVISLTNFNMVYNQEDTLVVSSIEDELALLKQEDLSKIKQRVLEDGISYKVPIVSEGGRGSGLALHLQKIEDPHYRKKIVQEVRQIVAEEEKETGIKFYIGGNPFAQVSLDAAYYRDMNLIAPLMFVMVLMVLLFIFRRPVYSCLPLFIIIVSAIWAFGFISAMGWYVTPLSEIALPVLVIYSVLNGIHFLNAFRNRFAEEPSRRSALLRTVERIWKPCFYASATTALGFLSLTISSVAMVRDLGFYCAFGIIVAWTMTFFLLPLFLDKISWMTVPPKIKKSSTLSGLLNGMTKFAQDHRPTIFIAVLGVLGLFAYWSRSITVDTNSLKLFKDDAEVVQSEAAARQIFGLWSPIEVSVKVKNSSNFSNPRFLQEIEKLQVYLENLPSIEKTISILDIIKKANQELHNGESLYYSIPDSSQEIDRLLGFIDLVGGQKGLRAYLTEDYTRTRITGRTAVMPSRQYAALSDQIDQYVKKEISPNLEVRLTGDTVVSQALLARILLTEIQSFALAFVLIFILIALSLRSWGLALIAIPPNIFPVVIISGIMGKFNIGLDVGTCTVASIVIAMAVDDTIHFLHRFKEELKISGGYTSAVWTTMATVGPPIVYTSLVLAAGFWVLIFSSYVPALNFGFLSGVAVLGALIGDIIILPALLLLFRPIKVEQAVSDVETNLTPKVLDLTKDSCNGGREL